MEKNNSQLLEEFLAKGGEIQKIPTVPHETKNTVNSTTKKVPELKTLAEGELLYGKSKKTRPKKVKKPDFSGINMDLIPEHIKSLINYGDQPEKTMEDNFEGDSNTRRSNTSDKN